MKQAVKVATKPLLLSHTALSESKAMGSTPLTGRQISRDHAIAPGSMQDYSQWVHLVGAMLRGGFSPQEAGKIRGRQSMTWLTDRRPRRIEML